MRWALLTAVFVVGLTSCWAQEVALPKDPAASIREFNERLIESAQRGVRASLAQQDYQIGAEDLIEISIFEVPELSRTVRVSASGEISLPLIGAVKAAGLSPAQLEQVLKELLRRTYLKDPQVNVFLKEFRSEPVSVMGAVKMPGLYHIQTRKSLIEVLAMAQGFSDGPQRHPGRTIVITRRPRTRGMRGATDTLQGDSSNGGAPASGENDPGKAEIVEVPIKELLQSGDPQWNVPIYPGDVVKVVPAGTVYVAGDVIRPGAFPLTDFDNISAIQALAMAGGTKRLASRSEAFVIRRDAAGNRTEEKIDLARVLRGKDADVQLGANDILFVPGSVGKESVIRAIETGIQTASGVLIYRSARY